VVFVAVVLACLGTLMIAGFVVLYAQLGALADELREARTADALKLETQLDAIADKQQGMRLDLEAMKKNVAALALCIEGPPSMRRPALPGQ
jgi:hypothetical protein